MKILILIISSINVIYGCSEVQVRYTPNTDSKITKNSITDSACLVCVIDKELNVKKTELTSHLSTNRYPNKIKSINNSIDSLNNIYNRLIRHFNNNIDSAIENCSKKYNLNYVSDIDKRDSLFADYYSWTYFNGHPIMDTTGGYVPRIKNGKYQVKKKGKLYPMTPEQYNNYIRKGLEITNNLIQHVHRQKTNLAAQITGIPIDKVDEACLMVLDKRCNYSFKIANERKTLFNDSTYQNFLKELMNL